MQEHQEKYQDKYKKNFSKKNLFQSFYSLVIDYHKTVIDYQKPKTVL